MLERWGMLYHCYAQWCSTLSTLKDFGKKILCVIDTVEEQIATLEQVMDRNKLLIVYLEEFLPSY